MLTNFKDFAVGTVSTGYDAAAVAIVMTTGHGANLPAAPFYAYWWDSTTYVSPDLDPQRELIYVGARAGDNLSSISRGQGDDAASTKNTAGKTYKLMATISAKEMDNRTKALGVAGPSGNLTMVLASAETDVANVVTVPANWLRAGDVIRWSIFWQHNAGAYTAAPRTALRFGGIYMMGLTSYWSTTEVTLFAEGTMIVRDVGSSGNIWNSGHYRRENNSESGLSSGIYAIDLTTAQSFTPSYRMDASGETIVMAKLSITLDRP